MLVVVMTRWTVVVLIVFLAASPVAAQTARVSESSSGAECAGSSWPSTISRDGRYVYFTSECAALTPDARSGLFVHDRLTRETRWFADWGTPSSDERYLLAQDGQTVTERLTGSTIDIPIIVHAIRMTFSRDGSHLAYFTDGAAGKYGYATRLYVHDTSSGTTCSAHVSSDGAAGNAPFDFPQFPAVYVPRISVSADGRFVAFESWSTNLVHGDTNTYRDIFVHDCSTRTSARMDIRRGGDRIILRYIHLDRES